MAASALGQTSSSTTATIRGKVTNQAGAGLSGAEVDVVGGSSGFVRTGKTGADGTFNLGGGNPGGGGVVVAGRGLPARSQNLRLLAGQDIERHLLMRPTHQSNEQ